MPIRRIWGYGTAFLVACLIAPASFAGQESATVTLDIRLTQAHAPIDVRVKFERLNEWMGMPQLVIAALNLSGQGSRADVLGSDFLGFEQSISHLTGWFIFDDRSRELWIGMPLQDGVKSGEVSVALSELLRASPASTSDSVFDYDLDLTRINSSRELYANSDRILFATITHVAVTLPSYSEVVQSQGWESEGKLTYAFDTSKSDKREHRLRLRDAPNALVIWLRDKMAIAVGGFAGSALAFLVLGQLLLDSRPKLVRILPGCFAAMCIGVLLVVGSKIPPTLREMAFNGAALCGLLAGATLIAFLPTRMFPVIELVIKRLKG